MEQTWSIKGLLGCISLKKYETLIPYFALLVFTAFAANLNHSNPFRYIVFIGATISIVGFRYEVGFDWPGYKFQFSELGELGVIDFFSQLPMLVVLYSQEPIYLIISYFSSIALPTYEYMQVGITALFMYSTLKLGKAMGVRNIIAAFIPIHLFLLFTLEFSAVRQIIAMSLFNLGLAFFLENRKKVSIWFYSTALFTQASTSLYLLVQLWTRVSSKWSKVAIILSGVLAIFLASGGLELLPVSMLPGFVGAKLNYYFFARNYQYNTLEQVFYIGVFLAIILILVRAGARMEGRLLFISKMIVFLCLFAFMAFWINTIRNRLMYEIIILTSLLVYGPAFQWQRVLRYILISSGCLFFMISLTKHTSLMYVPYQNYVWYQMNDYKSDGLDRFERLREFMLRNR